MNNNSLGKNKEYENKMSERDNETKVLTDEMW